jgi:hypothetical protein
LVENMYGKVFMILAKKFQFVFSSALKKFRKR